MGGENWEGRHFIAKRFPPDSNCPVCIDHRVRQNGSRRRDPGVHQGLHEGERYCAVAALQHLLDLHLLLATLIGFDREAQDSSLESHNETLN